MLFPHINFLLHILKLNVLFVHPVVAKYTQVIPLSSPSVEFCVGISDGDWKS